jgi:hypothetical protein
MCFVVGSQTLVWVWLVVERCSLADRAWQARVGVGCGWMHGFSGPGRGRRLVVAGLMTRWG